MGILAGLALLVAILLVVYIATHHKPPATASGADLAQTLAGAASDSWDAIKRDIPSIVSAEVTQLRNNLADMEARTKAAEDSLAAEKQASSARLAAVQAQVGAVIAQIGSQPASALVGPAVAAAQASDAARVSDFADTILTPGAASA